MLLVHSLVSYSVMTFFAQLSVKIWN